MSDLGRLLDELAANATPATTVQLVNGWVLRAAPGYPFRRCNSVLPNAHPATRFDEPALDGQLGIVDDFYRSRDMPVRYQVGRAAVPADLDARLAARGFEVEAPVDILVGGVAKVQQHTGRAADDLDVAVRPGVDDAWARAYGTLHGDDETPGARVAAFGRLLRTVGPRVLVATVDLDGAPAGVGFGVVERGWLGVFGMGTRPDVRRRGVATAILHTLAAASVDHGAVSCYLQVETDNPAAHALYRGAGFEPAHHYHYRTQR